MDTTGEVRRASWYTPGNSRLSRTRSRTASRCSAMHSQSVALVIRPGATQLQGEAYAFPVTNWTDVGHAARGIRARHGGRTLGLGANPPVNHRQLDLRPEKPGCAQASVGHARSG